MNRRSILSLLAAGSLTACSAKPKESGRRVRRSPEKVSYGPDAGQFAELTRPVGPSKGVVVVIHGGFWHAQYDLSLGRPLAASLAGAGWTAYNVEYRRVGNGGGWPTTFDDIAAAIDSLSTIDDLDTSQVVTLGHSAGGHLAVWAAGRPLLVGTDWADPIIPVTAAISQAGVLDLAAATTENLGDGAVQEFMGGSVDERYRLADPMALIPLPVPVRCVHGTSDQFVPLSQSTNYVKRAVAAGSDASVTEVDGDHFVVIDPASKAWSQTLDVLATL